MYVKNKRPRYSKMNYREHVILDYLSQKMTYPQVAREMGTSRESIAKSVIAMCNETGAASPKALIGGYIEWVEG